MELLLIILASWVLNIILACVVAFFMTSKHAWRLFWLQLRKKPIALVFKKDGRVEIDEITKITGSYVKLKKNGYRIIPNAPGELWYLLGNTKVMLVTDWAYPVSIKELEASNILKAMGYETMKDFLVKEGLVIYDGDGKQKGKGQGYVELEFAGNIIRISAVSGFRSKAGTSEELRELVTIAKKIAMEEMAWARLLPMFMGIAVVIIAIGIMVYLIQSGSGKHLIPPIGVK